MNRTILLEEERNKSEGERNRKFLIQHARQQDKTQRVHTNNTAPTRYQPTMQYRSSRSNTLQTTSNYKNHMVATTATITSPRVTIQHQRPVLDAINQDTLLPNALIKPQILP
jgi:hypothetical protein